eukprot:2437931-Amphidinium_carterae.1
MQLTPIGAPFQSTVTHRSTAASLAESSIFYSMAGAVDGSSGPKVTLFPAQCRLLAVGEGTVGREL